ncbi:MAG: ribosome maturation factor RimM [Bacteroidales bacterium]
MTARLDWSEMVVVGRIGRAHGLRGQVVVNPETDFPEERFEPGATLYRERFGGVEELRVATCRVQRGRPIVSFDGIDGIDAAEQLAGTELRVPAGALASLPPGAYYRHDLVGCDVQLPSGAAVGTVQRVDGDGGASRLVVATASGELLVPLAADICTRVDVAARLIVIEPLEGLLDLNVQRPRAETPRPHRGRRAWRPRRGL